MDAPLIAGVLIGMLVLSVTARHYAARRLRARTISWSFAALLLSGPFAMTPLVVALAARANTTGLLISGLASLLLLGAGFGSARLLLPGLASRLDNGDGR